MPGIECAADEGVVIEGGDGGPLPGILKLDVRSLAEDDGMGR